MGLGVFNSVHDSLMREEHLLVITVSTGGNQSCAGEGSLISKLVYSQRKALCLHRRRQSFCPAGLTDTGLSEEHWYLTCVQILCNKVREHGIEFHKFKFLSKISK